MRYTLYGQGEGLCGHADSAYVTVQNERVTDASISALKAGIRIGWTLRTALSIAPTLQVIPHSSSVSQSMQTVCQILWNTSPFLRITDGNAFFLQISSKVPPTSEIRRLLLEVDQYLSTEQRFRLGFAETPFLAQALVAWSRIERIPDALYLRVRRQQILFSPSVATGSLERGAPQTDWIRQMPIAACWFLSTSVREQLQALGVQRLWQFESVSNDMLIAHFGKEAQLWKNVISRIPDEKIQVNYPPDRENASWYAPLGEESEISRADELLEHLSFELTRKLQKASVGALSVGVCWETDVKAGRFEQQSKRIIYQPSILLAQLRPGRLQMVGSRLVSLEVYVSDLRPLQSAQTEFLLYQDVFYPEPVLDRRQLQDVWLQLLSKFPKQLQWGVKPTFRERRMNAIQNGSGSES